MCASQGLTAQRTALACPPGAREKTAEERPAAAVAVGDKPPRKPPAVLASQHPGRVPHPLGSPQLGERDCGQEPGPAGKQRRRRARPGAASDGKTLPAAIRPPREPHSSHEPPSGFACLPVPETSMVVGDSRCGWRLVVASRRCLTSFPSQGSRTAGLWERGLVLRARSCLGGPHKPSKRGVIRLVSLRGLARTGIGTHHPPGRCGSSQPVPPPGLFPGQRTILSNRCLTTLARKRLPAITGSCRPELKKELHLQVIAGTDVNRPKQTVPSPSGS